ncbi:hypothetical protein ATK17_2188 [Branchiibius hedensis]|uniref:Uncharacterized protein n=1 Tax=Branchiibius hedensis TaxID=672460 RepID=A0A2Y8ZUA7_9MICO|nr:hypothetical protein [Branchiibius hedensis]PWJ26046.1 hypothetical protein ATK17_2188 [Branchiibius hedensis]SSA34858.1 hypothetical protein SAMN04489750_2188 [Branchiibius hedensis]
MTEQAEYTGIQQDSVSGATVIVGDMIAWSDLAEMIAPDATATVIQRLVAASAPQTVLLAGPRAGLLLPHLPTTARIDVLTRSLDDIRALEILGGMHSRVSYYCGGLLDFQPSRHYDLIVALGGPQRLLSPDRTGLTIGETINRLGDALSEDGRLVTDLANELGLTDLVRAVPDPQAQENVSWWIGADGFSKRATYAREREGLLAGAGLTCHSTYAALPDLDAHNLLISRDIATDPDRVEAVRAVAAQVTTQELSELPVLRDVHATLDRVTAAGQLDDLAPAWLVVAGKGAPVQATLPDVVYVESGPARWTQRLVLEGDSVTRSWSDGHHEADRSEVDLTRTLRAEFPVGVTLETHLRAAAATRQQSAVRPLVRQYAAWLEDASAWPTDVAAQRVFATPDNILVSDDGLRLLDQTWSRAGVVSAGDTLVRGLRTFATRLLATGGAHPWRVGVTPDELTVTLAAMAGFSVTPADIGRVAASSAHIRATLMGTPNAADELLELDLESGRHARDLPAADQAGYRELLTRLRAVASEMRQKDGQIAWLEGTLRHRDRYIRRLEKTIENYETTLTYRAVDLMRAPRRIATNRAVSMAKSTADQVLPPGAMSKARNLAKRLGD